MSAEYQKIHLFRLLNEEKWMSPGMQLRTFNFEWGKAGLAICYDLRFPELFRKYALMGCNIIFLVRLGINSSPAKQQELCLGKST